MANKDYSKFSKRSKKTNSKYNSQIVREPVSFEEVTNLEPEDIIDVYVDGIVTKCPKLNVRKEPNADSEILCVIEENDKVKILESSDDIFYKVCIASSVEGYCMKKFIKII